MTAPSLHTIDTAPATLEIARTYPHPRARVWLVLTDPARFGDWFGPGAFAPRLGHTFTLADPTDPACLGAVDCRVVTLDPPERMAWTWQTPDDPSPGRVVFDLTETPEGTTLRIRHTAPRLPAGTRPGWAESLAKLGPLLTPTGDIP